MNNVARVLSLAAAIAVTYVSHQAQGYPFSFLTGLLAGLVVLAIEIWLHIRRTEGKGAPYAGASTSSSTSTTTDATPAFWFAGDGSHGSGCSGSDSSASGDCGGGGGD